ncbi:MAG: RNA polymerase sigma factor [Flavobacteriaceae bacterium]
MDEKQLLLSTHIKAAKEGKQASFNFLLEEYWSDTYRFLVAKTNNENEAEDLCIKTFSRAFDAIDSFNEDLNFKTWLLTIARNLFIDEVRKNRTAHLSLDKDEHVAYQIFDESPSPEDRLINEQNLAALKSLIKKLKPHYAQMIHLRYFQEFSYKEIAAHTGEPINNVKVKLLRARKLLAELIESNPSK